MTNPPDPIHTDRNVQHVDVRIYFGPDKPRDEMLDEISMMIQDSEVRPDIIRVYELVSDGFGRTVPGNKPIA